MLHTLLVVNRQALVAAARKTAAAEEALMAPNPLTGQQLEVQKVWSNPEFAAVQLQAVAAKAVLPVPPRQLPIPTRAAGILRVRQLHRYRLRDM